MPVYTSFDKVKPLPKELPQMTIRVIFSFAASKTINVLAAGSGGAKLLDANVDIGHQNSLQRGANLFNYCAGCHSIKYMRYNRMANDLGLSEETVKKPDVCKSKDRR